MLRTSPMAAVTQPARWGKEIVDVYFGEVRVRIDQTVVMKGDLLRDMTTGEVRVFVSRENDKLNLTAFN